MEFASQYSLECVDFARFVLPNALGNYFCGIEPFDNSDFSHERIGYIGVLPLALACYGLTRASPPRWQWGALILSVLGFALALGASTPFFEMLGKSLPGLLLFRCHGRVLSVVTVFLALLAGRGLDSWVNGETRAAGVRMWRWGLPACLLFALVVLSARAPFIGIRRCRPDARHDGGATWCFAKAARAPLALFAGNCRRLARSRRPGGGKRGSRPTAAIRLSNRNVRWQPEISRRSKPR